MNTSASSGSKGHAASDEQKEKKMESMECVKQTSQLQLHQKKSGVVREEKWKRWRTESQKSVTSWVTVESRSVMYAIWEEWFQEGGGAFRKKRSEGKESTYN